MAARENRIYVGSLNDPDYYFENEDILSAPFVQNVALVGQELSVDSFSPTVMDDWENLRDVRHFVSADGHEIELADTSIFALDVSDKIHVSDLISLEYGTPVWYYQEDSLIGKFYVENVTREAKNQYRINTVSVIGILDKMEHGGGLFLASTFGTVLSHILAEDKHGTGSPVIDYVIDDDVAGLPVSGWLPNDTKRNNLYRLIFANGVNIVKNTDTREQYNGCPRFTFIYTAAEDAAPVDEASIYNEGSVEYTKPCSNVLVMEHIYTPLLDEDPATLFDNTTGTEVAHAEICFDKAPIIVSTLTASGGLTIDEDENHNPLVSENHAIVTGNGKLTGIPYTHTTRTITSELAGGDKEKTVRVENCTMVNAINSANLLARLKAFYQPTDDSTTPPTPILMKTIRNGIVHNGERCGKAYAFRDPFGEKVTAFLSSMDGLPSSFVKASCVWYADYEPAGQQGLYQHVEIEIPEPDPEDPETIITEGDWTVPEGVTQFKVVLIGGGTGGGSGWPGENGGDAWTHTEVAETDDLSGVWYGAEGGDGGAGGAGGAPGRVKAVVVENAVPGTVYHWSLGSGGEGGAATGFIPDTFDELKRMLENTYPGMTYTTEQINAMITTEQSLSGWNGSPNAGSAGTATQFGIQEDDEWTTVWSTADQDAYVPSGGVYDPINDEYYALPGNTGIKGGKGGARQVRSGSTFNWVTDGEDVIGDNGETYRGGRTGTMLTKVNGLPEAKIKAYGGNGAGAAVGIDRDAIDAETDELKYPHINGGSDQSAAWDVSEDSNWTPPSPDPVPAPAPVPASDNPELSATVSPDRTTAEVGDTVTWTMTANGGNGEYLYYFTIYREPDIVVKVGEWQNSNTVSWTIETNGKYYVGGYVTDTREIETVRALQFGRVDATGTEPAPPPTTDGLYAKIGNRQTGTVTQLSGGVYGPMGPNTGKDSAIIPVRASGEEITVDTSQDFEINLVFKCDDQSVVQDSHWLFGGYITEKDPRSKASLENSQIDIPGLNFDAWNHGSVDYTVVYPGVWNNQNVLTYTFVSMYPDNFTPQVHLNKWYSVNLKKTGSSYISTLNIDGNTYTETHSYPTAFVCVFVPSFASNGDAGGYYHALCDTAGTYLDLDQCYIKQGNVKIWGKVDS